MFNFRNGLDLTYSTVCMLYCTYENYKQHSFIFYISGIKYIYHNFDNSFLFKLSRYACICKPSSKNVWWLSLCTQDNLAKNKAFYGKYDSLSIKGVRGTQRKTATTWYDYSAKQDMNCFHPSSWNLIVCARGKSSASHDLILAAHENIECRTLFRQEKSAILLCS